MSWLDDLVPTFVLLCKGQKHSRFDKESVSTLLKVLADKEKNKPKHKRLGFYHVSTYADSGLTKFLNRVEQEWSTSKEPEMSQAIQTPPNDSAHKLECVLSLELDKDTYAATDIHNILKDYLIQHVPTPFDCLVVQVAKVTGAWYDLHVRYSCNLIDACTLVNRIPWVKKLLAKPLSDFGRFTLSMMD